VTPTKLPAISGIELIRLLKKDDWQEGRRARHGITMTKRFDNKTRVTLIPTKGSSLPRGTLSAILGDKQTGLGKNGLLKLIEKK
jgi:predicted RNA binding protein YcfA (HicA-like mRNA interferase family)